MKKFEYSEERLKILKSFDLIKNLENRKKEDYLFLITNSVFIIAEFLKLICKEKL